MENIAIVALGAVFAASLAVCRDVDRRALAQSAPHAAPASSRSSSIHVALGTPTDADPSDDYIIMRPQYVASYNPTTHIPNWVSWELDASRLGTTPRHKGHFLADESLPAGWLRVSHNDYTGSGYDRGHMAPSDDRTSTTADNDATFILSNVAPQLHELNAGPWEELETYSRKLARRDGKELFITAGGIVPKVHASIGHDVAVPTEFFKIVVVLSPGQGASDVTPTTRTIAVVMPNVTNVAHDWHAYLVSVAEVERRSGYQFLSAVPAGARAAIVARVDADGTQ
jgi:endonuclease G